MKIHKLNFSPKGNDIEDTDYDPRANSRKEVFCRVDYSIDGKHIFLGIVRDVSAKGMLIEGSSEIPRGATINCAFQIKGHKPIKVQADIIRKRGRLYGLQFIDPWDTLRELLCRSFNKIEGQIETTVIDYDNDLEDAS